MVLNITCECMHTLCKNAYGLVHARLCNSAAGSLPWKLLRTYLESCANIVQAVICHPPSCRLALTRPPLSPDAVRLRNPSKSTLAHDAVAAAVLHKHHPIIRVGAGLIQFVYGSRSHLAAEATHHKNAFSPFSCEFSYPDWLCNPRMSFYSTYCIFHRVLSSRPRNCQNLRQPMAQSQERYHAGIIRSSALVQAPSSLFMVCTRSLATGLNKILFLQFSRVSRDLHLWKEIRKSKVHE